MRPAHVGLLNSKAIGDILWGLSMDYQMEVAGTPVYWLLWQPRKVPNHVGGWINFELFRLLQRAGFRKWIISGPDISMEGDDFHSEETHTALRHLIYFTYDHWHDEVRTQWAEPILKPLPEVMRRRFVFLHRTVEVPYATIKRTSVRPGREVGEMRDGHRLENSVHLDTVAEWIDKQGVEEFHFIGSTGDWLAANAAVIKLRDRFPKLTFGNQCGIGLEETFASIYNCEAHMCGETWSCFLSMQLGIKSTIIYQTHNKEPTDNMKPFFGPNAEWLTDPRKITW